MTATCRSFIILIAALTVASCGPRQADNEVLLQRFFGTCDPEYGTSTDVSAAQSECGIMTTLVNRFNGEHPEFNVRVSTVFWPGYDQLSSQLATGDAPDLVTMHQSAMADWVSRKLLEPMDDTLARAGVRPTDFTHAALRGVTNEAHIYGMPIDTWAPLWHINLNYFRQAGLVRDGKPVLPRSPEELLEQARVFKRATGKPYFVQSMVNEQATYTRNLYTFLMQQNAVIFADPQHIRLATPEARRVVELFKQLYDEDLTTKNQDYAAATRGFMNGDGGVYLVGTWVIGDFDAEARKPSRPLSNGYTVVTYPQLFSGRDVTFADGHAWVMPVKQRSATQRRAIEAFLAFFAQHDYDWSRTGHVPSFETVVVSDEFNALPHRQNIANLTQIGEPLPSGIERQFPMQDIIGEELAAAIEGHKPIDVALTDAEHRINELLFHVL
jgi:multiple sugar transport system substrate-binding protein